jgi:PAS domain S-box-containing protein
LSAINVVDLAGALASAAALVLILVGWKTRPGRHESILMLLIVVLTLAHDAGNFLEWMGITAFYDPIEDYLEVLTASLWGFFLYTFLQGFTEEKLKEIQSLDETILDVSPVAFVLRDRDQRVIRLSKAFEKVSGLRSDAVMGRTVQEFMPDSPGKEALIARINRVFQEGVQMGPEDFLAPSASDKYIRETLIPIFEHDGSVAQCLSVLEDISDLKTVEAQLRQVQELDEKILHGSPVAFVLHDRELRILRVSRVFDEVTGFKTSEVVGRKLKEFMPEGIRRSGIIKRMEQVRDEGVTIGPQDIESPLPGRYLRETILPIFDSAGDVSNILSVLEDITETKQVQEALLESEERYRLLFDAINDGLLVHEFFDSSPGRILEVNSRLCSMTGYSKEELLGKKPPDLVDPDSITDGRDVRKKLNDQGFAVFERVFVTKGGLKIPVEVNSHVFELKGKATILAVARDITERKVAERSIQASLREKDVLLKEIHHRVKNNLQVISGLLNLQAHHITGKRAKEIYKESQNRVKTMALIHEELYQEGNLASVGFREYIRQLATNLIRSYRTDPGSVMLDLKMADVDLVVDTAIPCGLIINELVSNALKHAFPKKGGCIRIEFDRKEGDEFHLVVADDGVGMPEELNFRETRTLGLQLVNILVEQLGGTIDLEQGEGTEFRITFREYREAGSAIH